MHGTLRLLLLLIGIDLPVIENVFRLTPNTVLILDPCLHINKS